MAAVLVTEFMDGSALAFLKNRVQVDYAPNICENHQEIMRCIAGVHALIVRNRTQVTADIFACEPLEGRWSVRSRPRQY